MRIVAILMGILIVTASSRAADAPPPADAAERAKFVGVWAGYAVNGKGENPDAGPAKLELTITETTITGIEIKNGVRVDHGQGEFTLDLTADPRHLDGRQTNARGRARNYVGIYTLEGNTLKWCVSPQKERPTTFETKKGQFLLILKRAATTKTGRGSAAASVRESCVAYDSKDRETASDGVAPPGAPCSGLPLDTESRLGHCDFSMVPISPSKLNVSACTAGASPSSRSVAVVTGPMLARRILASLSR